MPVKVRQAIDDSIRLLRRGGIVKPDQLPPMNPLLQNGEILADQPRIQRAFSNPKF